MSERSERQAVRLNAILRELQQNGSISINDLCATHQASLATIRRDLHQLEERGLLRRTHGGAVSIEPLFYEPFRKNLAFRDVVARHAEEKRRIGQVAAALAEPGAWIALTAGTTTTEVVRCLSPQGGFKVVTNTVNVAMELSKRKDIEVFVTGGHLRGDWFSLVGPAATQSMRQIFVDIVFLGADGIDLASGLTCHISDEAEINRVMIAQARKKIAVVDGSKFGVTASWRMCSVEDLDMIVTDNGVSEQMIAPYQALGVEVRRA